MTCSAYGCEYKGKSAKDAPDGYTKCPKCSKVELINKEYGVTLELTKTQAYVIREALESYSRMLIGQLEYSLEPIRWESKSDWNDDIKPKLDELTTMIFGFNSTNMSYGIGSGLVKDSARVAYDIQQVLGNIQSWHENPMGGITTNYDTPMRWSKEPLPKGKIV